jgi:hypothetical protein
MDIFWPIISFKYIFHVKNSALCDFNLYNLTRIQIRMDPHWFGSLDPDPHPHLYKKVRFGSALKPMRIHNTDCVFSKYLLKKYFCKWQRSENDPHPFTEGIFLTAREVRMTRILLLNEYFSNCLRSENDPHPFSEWIFLTARKLRMTRIHLLNEYF